jgi:hypothetical protein
MKKLRVASLLSQWLLSRLARRFDTPGAFEGSIEGSSFWMDASYHKWCRCDQRKLGRRQPLVNPTARPNTGGRAVRAPR